MSKNQLLVMGWEIVLYDSSTAANRLQALAHVLLFLQVYNDLTTSDVFITDAIKYVNQKTEEVNTLQKLDERIEAAEETTTNGVF